MEVCLGSECNVSAGNRARAQCKASVSTPLIINKRSYCLIQKFPTLFVMFELGITYPKRGSIIMLSIHNTFFENSLQFQLILQHPNTPPNTVHREKSCQDAWREARCEQAEHKQYLLCVDSAASDILQPEARGYESEGVRFGVAGRSRWSDMRVARVCVGEWTWEWVKEMRWLWRKGEGEHKKAAVSGGE